MKISITPLMAKIKSVDWKNLAVELLVWVLISSLFLVYVYVGFSLYDFVKAVSSGFIGFLVSVSYVMAILVGIPIILKTLNDKSNNVKNVPEETDPKPDAVTDPYGRTEWGLANAIERIVKERQLREKTNKK